MTEEMKPQPDISHHQMKLPVSEMAMSNPVVVQRGLMETPNNPGYCQGYWIFSTEWQLKEARSSKHGRTDTDINSHRVWQHAKSLQGIWPRCVPVLKETQPLPLPASLSILDCYFWVDMEGLGRGLLKHIENAPLVLLWHAVLLGKCFPLFRYKT